MKFTLYTADCTGNAKNTVYPNQKVITSEADLKKAVAFDHVCALYDNFSRSDANFQLSDVVPMDCDNDHSDDPEDWITPEKLSEMLGDVAYAVTYSRHHMLSKGSVSARPRFHVFFPTYPCKDAASHKSIKSRIYKELPFFDGNALDASRFLFGSKGDVVWHEGSLTIEDWLLLMKTNRSIPQGQRNSTMSRIYSRIDWKYIVNKYHVDKIIVVALVELGENAKTRNTLVSFEMHKAKGYVEYIALKDLFSLISETEYDIYLAYVKQYNSDIKKLIGYRTIITPSESSLLTMKKELEAKLRSYDFDDILRNDGLFTSQIETIKHHFWDDGRYRAVLGKSSFAESFISSEWYYQTHTISSMLEQTAIIAGYLKSVEQLLYTIIRFSINTGNSIKKRGGERNEYIEYTTDSESLADTTLGSLIGYSRHYSDLWSVNDSIRREIVNQAKYVLRQYLIRGKYANKLKSYASISAGWIVESYPEIIYTRN